MLKMKILLILFVVAVATSAAKKANNDVCRLSKDVGTCTNSIVCNVRYWYNKDTQKCDKFCFNGCGGNRNAFTYESDCLKACMDDEEICKQPKAVGTGSSSWTSVRYFYDANAQDCKQFHYRRTGGNNNNFASKPDCEKTCVKPCNQPKAIGTGSSWWTSVRYYYDASAQECKKFQYRSTGGNGNNFVSKSDCEKACINPCTQPKALGTGSASWVSVRYYFDANTQNCKKFHYRRTGGNGNNFASMSDCEKTCVNRCRQPKAVGTGSRSFVYVRYFYNPATATCVKFNFLGSNGNRNNFLSKPECERACF